MVFNLKYSNQPVRAFLTFNSLGGWRRAPRHKY